MKHLSADYVRSVVLATLSCQRYISNCIFAQTFLRWKNLLEKLAFKETRSLNSFKQLKTFPIQLVSLFFVQILLDFLGQILLDFFSCLSPTGLVFLLQSHSRLFLVLVLLDLLVEILLDFLVVPILHDFCCPNPTRILLPQSYSMFCCPNPT